jgi:hypothetical protein
MAAQVSYERSLLDRIEELERERDLLSEKLQACILERDNLLAAVESHNDAATTTLGEIAALCGSPGRDYPGQIVRDVAAACEALQIARQDASRWRAECAAMMRVVEAAHKLRDSYDLDECSRGDGLELCDALDVLDAAKRGGRELVRM